MEPNLAVSIYVRFSINFLHFVVSEEKIFLNSSQSETRISLGGHICWWNRTKWRKFIENLT
jgi:hypothetical protein